MVSMYACALSSNHHQDIKSSKSNNADTTEIFDEPGHYINMCAFIARTSTAGITGLTGPNYAIWTMRENLENECNNEAYRELVNGAAV
jgi:hypothetical protein